MQGNEKVIHRNRIKETRVDMVYDVLNIIMLSTLLLVVLYPLYFVIIASFSTPSMVSTGKVIFWPDKLNLEGYKMIIGYERIWTGYRNSILYTVFGTLLSVSITISVGYVFTRRELPFRNIFIVVFTIPMFFSGGLIPTFMLVRNLNLVDNPIILILLGCVSMYNIIIARTFIDSTIPTELFEAARIDGCNNIQYFLMIVVPLSKALIAVQVVFAAVGQWNNYFNALIYINSREYLPLQMVIREILSVSTNLQKELETATVGDDAMQAAYLAESVKYGVIVISSLPMLIVYPFAQKYFVQGVMIGSVKG
jgi:putative aldouronate transport system permease protein